MIHAPLPIRSWLTLALLCVPVLAACGQFPVTCQMVYCQDGLSFQSSRLASLLAAEPTLTMRVCLDGQCTQAVTTAGSCIGDHRSDHLHCFRDTVTLPLRRSDDLSASPHVVTIAVSRPDGTTLLSDRVAGVRFRRSQPNGPGCDPTCYSAAIRLQDA